MLWGEKCFSAKLDINPGYKLHPCNVPISQEGLKLKPHMTGLHLG